MTGIMRNEIQSINFKHWWFMINNSEKNKSTLEKIIQEDRSGIIRSFHIGIDLTDDKIKGLIILSRPKSKTVIKNDIFANYSFDGEIYTVSIIPTTYNTYVEVVMSTLNDQKLISNQFGIMEEIEWRYHEQMETEESDDFESNTESYQEDIEEWFSEDSE